LLFASGLYVRAFSRHAPPAGLFPDGVDVRIGDVANADDVRRAVEGVDAVIHLAALLHVIDPPPELQAEYERVNVGGTRYVVDAALQAGVGRLVFFSTIAVYGTSGGRVLNEDSPLAPDSFYAKTKADAERIVLGAKGADGKPLGAVLRLGAVYGPRIKGNYRRLLLALARGMFLPIGSGANRRTLVYDADVAQAALLAMKHPNASGQVFNVTDGNFHSMNSIIETICAVLGRRPPRLRLPLAPVRGLAGMIEDVGRFFGWHPPITRSAINKYTEDIAVDGNKICRQLGFVPACDLEKGWRETVDAMRRSNDL
jgi:UDP-glucose 4-epimerase